MTELKGSAGRILVASVRLRVVGATQDAPLCCVTGGGGFDKNFSESI